MSRIEKNNLMYPALLFFILIITAQGLADNRRYAWTYEYQTLPRGKGEIESYFTLSAPRINQMKGVTASEHQLELEVGMTDRFDIAIEQIFRQNPGVALSYQGYEFRARYRISEKGKYFFDPLIFLEYKGVADFSKHEIEWRLILAKDIDRWNISLNPTLSFEREDEWITKPEYAIGAGYDISDLFRIGLEAKGSEEGNYIGPVISHGRDNLWVALGSAFKIGTIKNGIPGFQIRMLLGVGL